MTQFTHDEIISIGLAVSQHTDILRRYPDVYKTAIDKYEMLTDKILQIMHEMEIKDRG